jgi:histidine decarboxylase
MGINAWRNHNAITVIFPQPSKEICIKWQLASENRLTHIICMPGVTKDIIDSFINDVVAERTITTEVCA